MIKDNPLHSPNKESTVKNKDLTPILPLLKKSLAAKVRSGVYNQISPGITKTRINQKDKQRKNCLR